MGATNPGDFRPITMVHSFAKLISKVLSLRLAPRLPDLISKNQNAFIKARSIHDYYKYVQRAAALIRKKQVPMLLLKLDISKAFDTLSWPFLLETLRAHGFSAQWCSWIESLLSSASSRIMLNGRQGPPIRHMRGVRQGDSLSPMLFIIAMDILHRLLAKAVQASANADPGNQIPMQLVRGRYNPVHPANSTGSTGSERHLWHLRRIIRTMHQLGKMFSNQHLWRRSSAATNHLNSRVPRAIFSNPVLGAAPQHKNNTKGQPAGTGGSSGKEAAVKPCIANEQKR